MRWHPAWCDPQHCYVTDDGVRVHQTALACYEDGLSRFELQLLCPEDEFVTYLQLLVEDLRLGRSVCAFAPVVTVAWLRDQLAEHLEATVHSNGGHPVSGVRSPQLPTPQCGGACCRAGLDDADAAGERDRVLAVDSSITGAPQHAVGARPVVISDSEQDTGVGHTGAGPNDVE